MKAFHYCQHCGNLSLPKDVKLTPKQRQILELMLRRPQMSSEQLCGVLSIRPNTLHVHLSNLNRELRNHGIFVRSSTEYSTSYRLIAEAAE